MNKILTIIQTINPFKSRKKKMKFNDEYITPAELKPAEYSIKVPEMFFCQPEIEGNPNILIMDDFTGMAELIKDELSRVQYCDVYKEFNIMMATGNYAGFTVEKYLKDPDKTVDVGILDITLGGVINNIEYDGIDVAIMLKQHNPKCLIKFITGHTLNKYNPEIFEFIQKFEEFFQTPIDETKKLVYKGEEIEMYKHIINKNGNRVSAYGDLIEEYYTQQKWEI
jgi:hypothetical protein